MFDISTTAILDADKHSGYHFFSLEEIKPYLEPTTAGISTQWAIRAARHYNCHVTVGYPEITSGAAPTQYNSTVTVSPTGAILANYRKSFLYYTDETWASEGPSSHEHNLSNPASPDSPFFSGPLGDLGNVTLGICMDINPYKFTAAWDAYEFAATALANKTNLLCVSMAWLCHLTPEELMRDPSLADVATIAYWVERFQPLVEANLEEPVYVIMANRSGMEKGVCYAGSSTVIKIDKGEVSLFETAGKSDERCLVVDLSDRPKFQVRSGK